MSDFWIGYLVGAALMFLCAVVAILAAFRVKR